MPITLNGTTGEIPATWTTATRPASPTTGQYGYNTTTAALDVYNGSAWTSYVNSAAASLVLNGATSGTTTLSPSAVASGTVTLPAGTGTAAVQGVSTNIVSGTAVTASGTAVLFTSIPSWVRRITVSFKNLQTSGTSPPQIQVGSGSVTTSGYLGANGTLGTTNATANFTAGFGIGVNTSNWASTTIGHGTIFLSLLNSSTNIWAASGSVGRSDSGQIYMTAGSITLSGVLDRVNITMANGTDTFTAGSVNIMYE